MKTISSNYEYSYCSSNSGHHHAYLLPPLLQLLGQVTLPSQQRPRVLDLGCGNGSLSHFLAQQGYEVVGVEESESGIKQARHNFSNCQFIQASIYDLPYNDLKNSFDYVISCEVIEHLLYPRELVRAAKRCLKFHGRLIMSTPYHSYLKNLIIALSGKMDGHFTTLWDGGHIKFFSVETMTTLLKTEEMNNIEFKFAGRMPYLWKSMLCSSSISEEK